MEEARDQPTGAAELHKSQWVPSIAWFVCFICSLMKPVIISQEYMSLLGLNRTTSKMSLIYGRNQASPSLAQGLPICRGSSHNGQTAWGEGPARKEKLQWIHHPWTRESSQKTLLSRNLVRTLLWIPSFNILSASGFPANLLITDPIILSTSQSNPHPGTTLSLPTYRNAVLLPLIVAVSQQIRYFPSLYVAYPSDFHCWFTALGKFMPTDLWGFTGESFFPITSMIKFWLGCMFSKSKFINFPFSEFYSQ